MSVRVMSWVWDHATVGGSELLVLLAIADCANDDGTNAFPSIATLARKTRVNERTVQRITRRLQDGGHLHVEPTTGGRYSNRYAVLMTAPEVTPTSRNPVETEPAGEPPAECHPGNLPPRADATPGVAPPPPQGWRSSATRTSLNRPRPVRGRPAGSAAGRQPMPPPGRCTHHLGQSAHNCAPCRSERVGR
jgi:hypothetical protein